MLTTSVRQRRIAQTTILITIVAGAIAWYLRTTGMSQSEFSQWATNAISEVDSIEISPNLLYLTGSEPANLHWWDGSALRSFQIRTGPERAVLKHALVPVSRFSKFPWRYSEDLGLTYKARNPTKGGINFEFRINGGRTPSITIKMVMIPWIVLTELDTLQPVLTEIRFHDTNRTLYGYCRVPGLEFWKMMGARDPE